MHTLEDYTPRGGLSIPCITCLDGDGEPLDSDQRRLVRFLIQGGRGADVIFAMGTTGEWNRLDQARRHRVIRVVVEETRKHESRLARRRTQNGGGLGGAHRRRPAPRRSRRWSSRSRSARTRA